MALVVNDNGTGAIHIYKSQMLTKCNCSLENSRALLYLVFLTFEILVEF